MTQVAEDIRTAGVMSQVKIYNAVHGVLNPIPANSYVFFKTESQKHANGFGGMKWRDGFRLCELRSSASRQSMSTCRFRSSKRMTLPLLPRTKAALRWLIYVSPSVSQHRILIRTMDFSLSFSSLSLSFHNGQQYLDSDIDAYLKKRNQPDGSK